MDLRIPSGGGGFLSTDDADDDRRWLREDSADIVADASAEDVTDALAQLFAGNFEFVGLNGDDVWIQTADLGGGYVFERAVSDDGPVPHPETLSADQLQDAFLRFHAGDVDAGLDWAAASTVSERKPTRGRFRR
jgi:hypothetical protein